MRLFNFISLHISHYYNHTNNSLENIIPKADVVHPADCRVSEL